MFRSLSGLLSTLVGAALSVPGIAAAQNLGPSLNDSRARLQVGADAGQASGVAELQDWLGRLVGQFSITADQVSHGEPARETRLASGSAECQAVGTGPGVSCLFNFTDADGDRAPGLPQLMLFGIDADESAIQLLQLDFGEPVISARGVLQGDTVAFSSACPDRAGDAAPDVTCDRLARIRAASGSQLIEVSLEWDTDQQAGAFESGLADTRIGMRREPG